MSNLPDIQLIFVTGALDREAWRHQEKYFSRSCRVEVIGGGKFGEVREELEDMLDNCDNAVVIGAEFGNYVIKSLEGHQGVMSTVFTGLFENFPEVSERRYRYMKEFMSKPKIFKKLFFREKTDYRIIKKFLRDIKLPDYEVYSSYSGLELDVPLKNSLTVYDQSCRFSKMSKIEEMRSNSEIAIIDGGTFSFYERPQEFNKALHDYLQGKSDYLNRRELVKAAQENQSLKDFNSLRVKQ